MLLLLLFFFVVVVVVQGGDLRMNSLQNLISMFINTKKTNDFFYAFFIMMLVGVMTCEVEVFYDDGKMRGGCVFLLHCPSNRPLFLIFIYSFLSFIPLFPIFFTFTFYF